MGESSVGLYGGIVVFIVIILGLPSVCGDDKPIGTVYFFGVLTIVKNTLIRKKSGIGELEIRITYLLNLSISYVN